MVTSVYLFQSNPEVTEQAVPHLPLNSLCLYSLSSVLWETERAIPKLLQAHRHRHNIHATEEWTSGEGEMRSWPQQVTWAGLLRSYAVSEAARSEGRGFPGCSCVNSWYLVQQISAPSWGTWREHSIPFWDFHQGTNKRSEGLSNIIRKAHVQGPGRGYSRIGVCKSLICILDDSVVKLRLLWLGNGS